VKAAAARRAMRIALAETTGLATIDSFMPFNPPLRKDQPQWRTAMRHPIRARQDDQGVARSPSVAELVDFVVRLEDDPARRSLLDGMPYDFFRAAVDDGLIEGDAINTFAALVGEAVRQDVLGYRRELGGTILPPPDAPWTDHVFQSRLGYYSTTEGQQMAALYRQRHGGVGEVARPAPGAEHLRDVFISHAGEDKDTVARPLSEELVRRDRRVWFDEYELILGDSLRGKIGDGLKDARVGVVILSPSFFAKRWTRWELDGLTARQIGGEPNVVLPVWHEVGIDDVRSFSPPLADLVAVESSLGIDAIADAVERVLDRLAAGDNPPTALEQASLRSDGGRRSPARASRQRAADAGRPGIARRLAGELEESEDLLAEALDAGRYWRPPRKCPDFVWSQYEEQLAHDSPATHKALQDAYRKLNDLNWKVPERASHEVPGAVLEEGQGLTLTPDDRERIRHIVGLIRTAKEHLNRYVR
jgi:TIR domain